MKLPSREATLHVINAVLMDLANSWDPLKKTHIFRLKVGPPRSQRALISDSCSL